MRYVSTYEYSDILLTDAAVDTCRLAVTETEADALERHLIKQKLSEALVFKHRKISTTHYVGVIRHKDVQIEILPKLLKKNEDERGVILDNLLYMLAYVRDLDVVSSEAAVATSCRHPFLEVLIREFAQSLWGCLKRLTPKNYVQKEENIRFLKGKLKFAENIRYNAADCSRFFCQYDDFSENNLLNQLFLFVAASLLTVAEEAHNRKLLRFIIHYFADVDLVRTDKYQARKIKLSRQQELFEKPFKLAKMFLEQMSVDLAKNKVQNVVLLWDMNVLFERFIFEFIRRHTDYRVTYQKGRRLLRLVSGKHSYGNTYVDVLLTDYSGHKIILDTKYKLNSGANNDFSNADVYQVAAYSLIHNTDKAVLLYPAADGDNGENLYLLNTTFAEKHSDTEQGYFIKLARIDLRRRLRDFDVQQDLVQAVQKILNFDAEKPRAMQAQGF